MIKAIGIDEVIQIDPNEISSQTTNQRITVKLNEIPSEDWSVLFTGKWNKEVNELNEMGLGHLYAMLRTKRPEVQVQNNLIVFDSITLNWYEEIHEQLINFINQTNEAIDAYTEEKKSSVSKFKEKFKF